MQFSPSICHFLTLRSSDSSQKRVLEHIPPSFLRIVDTYSYYLHRELAAQCYNIVTCISDCRRGLDCMIGFINAFFVQSVLIAVSYNSSQ
jgi:hypothetical protein